MKAVNRAPRALVLSCTLALVLALGTTPVVRATGVPVVDVSHIGTSLTSQFQALAQYGKQLAGMAKDAAHYKATYDHYQQQLIKLQRMASSLSFSGSKPLSKVPEDYMVDAKCGGNVSSFDLKGMLGAFVPDPNGDIVQQQRLICGLVQTNRNLKFNETIDFLTRVKKETTTELQQMASRRDSAQTQATVQASTDDQIGAGIRLDAVHRDYSSKMQMYDNQIASLQDVQRAIASSALRGMGQDGIGTLIKTGTLQGALKVRN